MLLIIHDKVNNQPGIYTVDEYKIRQVGKRIYGSIERIYSEQNQNRKYSFKGYRIGNEIIYSFCANDLSIDSYGICNLKLKGDYNYSGNYYRPLGKTPKKIFKIELTNQWLKSKIYKALKKKYQNLLEIIQLINKILLPTLVISNCLFSHTYENTHRFSFWCVLAKLSAKPLNYS